MSQFAVHFHLIRCGVTSAVERAKPNNLRPKVYYPNSLYIIRYWGTLNNRDVMTESTLQNNLTQHVTPVGIPVIV